MLAVMTNVESPDGELDPEPLMPGHPLRASTIAHGGLTILGPMTAPELDGLLDAAALPETGRALDIGCGKGDLLVRLAARGLHATGVDRNAAFLREAGGAVLAAGAADRVQLVHADAGAFEAAGAPGQRFDVVACVGSSGALGGPVDAPARLAALAKPGGAVLLGEGYRRHEPTLDQLASFGVHPRELVGWDGTLDRMTACGMHVEATADASLAAWDAYEAAYAEALDAWATVHPQDPQAPALLAQAHAFRTTWRAWRRAAMGFVTALLRVPAA